MKYESLIFDIDGTLWDTRATAAASYNALLKEEGLGHITVTAEQLLKLFGKTNPEISDVLFDTVPKPRRYRLFAQCSERSLQGFREDPELTGYPGVRETLEQLSKTHRLFLVSNSEKGYPEITLEKLQLGPLFAGHMCYGDTLLSKGETIRCLMEKYGIQNAVYIGDTQGDCDAAAAAGIPFIWCSYGFGKADAYSDKVDAFAQLLQREL